MSASWLSEDQADLDEFVEIARTPTNPADYPHAARIEQGIVVFSVRDSVYHSSFTGSHRPPLLRSRR